MALTGLPHARPVQHRFLTVGENVTIPFDLGQSPVTGALLWDPSIALLKIDGGDGSGADAPFSPVDTRLTVNLAEYGIYPSTPDEVLIKDWGVYRGVADSLVVAGIAAFVAQHHVGPHERSVMRLRVLAGHH